MKLHCTFYFLLFQEPDVSQVLFYLEEMEALGPKGHAYQTRGDKQSQSTLQSQKAIHHTLFKIEGGERGEVLLIWDRVSCNIQHRHRYNNIDTDTDTVYVHVCTGTKTQAHTTKRGTKGRLLISTASLPTIATWLTWKPPLDPHLNNVKLEL